MSNGRKPTVETWVKRLRKAAEDFNVAKDALTEHGFEIDIVLVGDNLISIKELKLVKLF
jgi:hypothetical protein